MSQVSETLVVEGIHCMQCIPKIGSALQGVEGLLAGSATLAGEVHIVFDDGDATVVARTAAALAAAGFPVAADA